MTELEKAYNPGKHESKIYENWEKTGLFEAKVNKDKEPFTIMMPPPNATGTLHLGHAVMLAIQDILIRHKRMQGHECLWLPGTDHAAIATQNVVEKKLQDKGIENPRAELGREKLLNEIRSFVEDSKDTIRNQVRKMGSSCDWSREKYTLDEDRNHAVNEFFKRMYEAGLIYQGDRSVNWDPAMQTTIADDELEYKEENSKFYYFQYGPFVIGTARPETKFADKIIIVHPDDKRYKKYHNKEFEVEWINGSINAKCIPDESADPEMGSGAMTITPAHSLVDFELAQKYNLETPQIIGFDGKLLDIAGEFAGMHIKEARAKIVEKLDKKGLLVKVDENYVHNIALNSRGKGIVEPQIMKQWFIDVNKAAIDWKGKKQSLKQIMQDVVDSGMIKLIPDRFNKIYFHWINNLRDWCISRQIWWGHQVPMWYKVSEEDKKEWEKHPDSSSYLLQALNLTIEETIFSEDEPKDGHWIRDPDTLDTWFSSSMWTFSTLGWPEHTDDFKYFHPTSVLETGYDIIFFWVARMILASTFCLRSDNLPEEECIPFKEVYLHGLIRDINGLKMSKSRPETCIDPLEMIEKYGTDPVRLSLIIGNTPGTDMRLYEEKIAGYRNFVNKIWNASRFALLNVEEKHKKEEFDPKKDIQSNADKWILTKLQELINEVDQDMAKYRFSDAANKIYDFTWGQYCDWYLEISKGEHLNPPVLLHVLKTLLKLLHPFTPFVTEVIWSNLKQDKQLIEEAWPTKQKELSFPDETEQMEQVNNVITAIRSIRAEKKIAAGKKIDAIIYAGPWTQMLESKREPLLRMARLNNLTISTDGDKIEKALWKLVNGIHIYLPAKDLFDIEKETENLRKQLQATEQKMHGLEKRLSNKAFLDKAPEEIVKKEKATFQDLTREFDDIKQKIEELQSLQE